jgi:hypothetical protein
MKRLIYLIPASLIVVVSLLGATYAHADTISGPPTAPSDMVEIRDSPLAKANPHISIDVIANLPAWLLQKGDMYIDPSITATTPLITTEGDVVPGQSSTKSRAAAACGSRMSALPGGSWSSQFDSNCGMIGINNDATVTYSPYKALGVVTSACMQWRGYRPIMKVPTTIISGWKETWTGDGCSLKSTRVKWGNVMSVPSGKVASMGAIQGWSGGYNH